MPLEQFLKEQTDWIACVCDGSWFQALVNEQAPKFVIVELMTRSSRVVDHIKQ